jgi:hypothetical protein
MRSSSNSSIRKTEIADKASLFAMDDVIKNWNK